MRIYSLPLAASILLATMQASFAQSPPDDGVMNRITPEKMVEILQDAGYRAEIAQGQKSKFIRTGMSGYKVAVYFYDCHDDGCASLQFSTGFNKSEKYTASLANKWNSDHRYARAYVSGPDDGFYFEYDFVLTGVTAAFIKDNLSLYEQQLGMLEKEAS
jgi:Putative bacterial sensory transduction regulator